MVEGQLELREALKRVAVALKRSGIPFALIGGYAVWARGGPEPEHDVDFMVADDDAPAAAEWLASEGFQVVQPPEDWLFKVFDGDGEDAPMVDLIFRLNGTTVEGPILERAQVVDVLSVHMPVLSATDLVASKMQALHEHSCDVGKVLPSARALREQVDWPTLREQVAGNPFAEACLFLLDRLDVSPT